MMQSRDIKRPNVAVASLNGNDVDMHIGHARRFLIYGPGKDGQISMIGTRTAPERGGGETRWQELADVLDDCFALLASGAGPRPVKALEDRGIVVFITEGTVKWSVDIVFGGGKKKSAQSKVHCTGQRPV